MTPEIQKYIELLESQLGYAEKSGSYTKFGDWYGKNVEFDADYSSAPWCDMYLSWAAHKLGYEDWIGQFAWTVAHAKWFKEQGAWGKTPKPGAFVFYDWSGSNDIDNIDHVGIVTKVEGGTIHTIEGNIDGGVAKRKERDTSKVVGYGYPDRVKERLDAAAAKKAQKEAREQAGQDGTIQLGEESLASMIPRGDTGRSAQVPLDAGRIQSQDPGRAHTPSTGQVEGRTPAEAQGRAGDRTATQTGRSDSTLTGRSGATSDAAPQQQAATAPRAGSTTAPRPAATQQSPQTGAAPAPGTVKKGKHAKPATADTEAATAEPLPAHGDASATGPLPAINSPTLIGSALVAALALLAVAKTRRLRLSTGLTTGGATAGKPARPSRAKGRRRRRGPAPVTATAKTAVELRESADRLAASAALRSLTAANAASDALTSANAASDVLTSANATADVLTSATASDVLTSATASNLRHGVRAGGARHRKLPFETRPFDLSTDAPRHHTHERPTHEHHPHEHHGSEHHGSEHHGSEHHAGGRHTAGHHEPRRHTPGHRRRPTPEAGFTPAFDSEPYEPDLDLGRFAFTEHTGPLERITFTDETGPVEVVLDTGPLRRVVDTGPFERIVIPGASSAFDAFSPPRRRGGGDGVTAPDPRAYRGRRRRAAMAAAEEHAGFSHDLPLRGRRHRRTRTDDEHRLVGGGRHRA
ncbi:CHAP domain-containing protein [[Actinomadura] parvosata]|uniref:CHAP domain-containing protein n=1 Tax=[Actinomadura] parvosata TaxID=1955412 RepID=UPI00406D202F